jgi:hypothetical protein
MLLVAAIAVAAFANAEEWQCGADAGCTARITEDGEVHDVEFRKGDMINSDAGWSASTDDGWVKIKTNGGRTGGTKGLPKLGFTIGEVWFFTSDAQFFYGTYAARPPKQHAQFLRPVVSLAAQPPAMCLIGL